MKKSFYLLPGALLTMALAGCCANDACNCDDTLADALFFKINYTAHRQRDASGQVISFNAKDVDTLRIYRTSRPPIGGDTLSFVRTTDSVTVARSLTYVQGDTLIASNVTVSTTTGTRNLTKQDIVVINNASPFASTSTTKLSGYTYRIGILSNGRNRRKPIAIYYLTNIQLFGRYNADGCCTCYQNTGKVYRLSYRLPGTTQTSVRQVDAADSANVNRIVRLPYTRR